MLAIGTKSLQDSHLITLILPCSCSLVDSRPRILHSALVSCWCDCCGCCCGCYCGCCYFGSLAAAVGPPAAGFFQVFSDLAFPRHVSDVQINGFLKCESAFSIQNMIHIAAMSACRRSSGPWRWRGGGPAAGGAATTSWCEVSGNTSTQLGLERWQSHVLIKISKA